MPLDREHVTVASRRMLPSYILFFGGLGLSYILGFRVGAAPMLRFADAIMPIQLWGAVFLGCGILMAIALIRHERMLYRYALTVCGLSMAVWMALALLGMFFEPVTLSAWLWPFIAMQACWASNRSLAKGERD